MDMQLNLFPRTTLRSPLQYAGGKSRARAVIASHFPRVTTLVSPFLGGGSVELYIAARDHARVLGYDVYQPIVDTWHCVLYRLDALIAKLESLLTWIGRPREAELQQINFETLQQVESQLERAAFLIFKSCLCWGSLWSGRRVRNHIRVDGRRVLRASSGVLFDTAWLQGFSAPTFKVSQADFRETLHRHKEEWAYIDPPYANPTGPIYVSHKTFPHEALARILWERKRFVLSYNNCDEVRQLYPTQRFKHYTPCWHWGIGNKKSNELIIVPK